MKALLGMTLLVATLTAQTVAPDRQTEKYKREIIGKLRWRILWDQWPSGFRVSGGVAAITVALTSESVYFCSNNLRGCMQYEIRFGDVGRDIGAKVLEGQLSETDAVIQWMRENGEEAVPPPAGKSPRVLRGVASPNFLLWTMEVPLPTQKELIEEYKKSRPSQLEELRAWLDSEFRSSDYESITIACFAPTDEDVYLYGRRKTLGPIVLGVFDDKERGWTVAGFSDRPEEAKHIAAMRDRIQKIECGQITF